KLGARPWRPTVRPEEAGSIPAGVALAEPDRRASAARPRKTGPAGPGDEAGQEGPGEAERGRAGEAEQEEEKADEDKRDTAETGHAGSGRAAALGAAELDHRRGRARAGAELGAGSGWAARADPGTGSARRAELTTE